MKGLEIGKFEKRWRIGNGVEFRERQSGSKGRHVKRGSRLGDKGKK